MSETELAFVVQHGLAPQIYRALPEARPQLESRFQEDLKRSLLLTAELSRLLDALPPAIPFKGPVLAQRLYGDVAGREYCDLDLLLGPADIPAAIAALEKLAYAAALPLQPWQLQAQLRNGCEYAMSNGPVHVELHWQFAPRQLGAVFDIDQLFRRAVKVRLGDRDLPVLSPEDDFLMLVVHGTKHGWSKLAWLADVAALLRTGRLDWGYIESESRRMHVSRMVAIACLLVEWLSIDAPARASLVADPQAQALAREVQRAFSEGIDLESMRAARHRFVMTAHDSAAGRAAYVLRYVFTPTLDDWNFLRLPAAIRWLYPAIRLLRLATQKY